MLIKLDRFRLSIATIAVVVWCLSTSDSLSGSEPTTIGEKSALVIAAEKIGIGHGSLSQFTVFHRVDTIRVTQDSVMAAVATPGEGARVLHLEYKASGLGVDTCSRPRSTRSGDKSLDIWLDASTRDLIKAVIHSTKFDANHLPEGWERLPTVQDCGPYGGQLVQPTAADPELDVSTILCSISRDNDFYGDEILIYRLTCLYGQTGLDKTPFMSLLGVQESVGPYYSIVIRDFPRYKNDDPTQEILRPAWAKRFVIDARTGEHISGVTEVMTGPGIPEH